MINVQEYLNTNKNRSTYALVTYDNKTYPVWFTNHGTSFNKENDSKNWFLESPCYLQTVTTIDEPIYDFAKRYIDGLLNEDADEEEYINDFVLPMIVDNVLYEIENFQVSPYLPKEVYSIKFITERECLLWILENREENSNV